MQGLYEAAATSAGIPEDARKEILDAVRAEATAALSDLMHEAFMDATDDGGCTKVAPSGPRIECSQAL